MTNSRWAYVSGDFVLEDQASVSIKDFGFLYGAGIYEVIAAYEGKPYRIKEHLNRLKTSGELAGMVIEPRQIEDTIRELLALNNDQHCQVYIEVTFGAYPLRSHILPQEPQLTQVIFTQPIVPATEKQRGHGIHLLSIPDRRSYLCHIKSVSLLPNVLAATEAVQKGYDDAVLVEPETGLTNECSSATLFCVKEGIVYTAPEGPRLLPGITRLTIIKLGRKAGIPVREEAFTIASLKQADEAFVSSTTREILPVRAVDDTVISQSPGPVTKQLASALVADIEHETGAKHWLALA